MIITLTMNPAIDKTACVDDLVVGGLNRLDQVIMNAGGKGINVSKTIHALGGVSKASGLLGGNNGRYIENALNNLSIENDFVHIDGETRVNLKVLNQDKTLTELNESGPVISEKQVDELFNKVNQLLHEQDILVLSGSVPKGVDKDFYAKMIERAKAKSVQVILDADGELFDLGIQAKPTIIKPNKYEICKYFNQSEDIDFLELIGLGRELLNKGLELVVISMGKEGSIFIKRDCYAIAKAIKIEAHSSVGAGDAMVAALAIALDKKMNFKDMITLAVASSAGAVLSKGTSPAERSVVDELMKKVEINLVEE